MRTWTRRLGALAVAPPNTWVEFYRAPETGTTVIRDVLIVNASTLAVAEVAIRLRPLTKAGTVWIGYWKDLPIGTMRVDMRQVIAPREALEVFSSTTGLNVLITGYVFDV